MNPAGQECHLSSAIHPIRTTTLEGRATGIPLVVQPDVDDLDLIGWAANNAGLIRQLLYQHGALLFRGFRIASLAGFKEFAQVTSERLMEYSEPSTTRSEVADQVYTTTEYPATETIPLHNEMSYSSVWPLKIWFHCVTPAETGGETPIGDSRLVFKLLDRKIIQKFTRKKVMYVRNYGLGLGLSWQTVFRTTDKSRVESHCRKHGIDYEWLGGGRLRTRQIRQAVAFHPHTGDLVWFNQAHIHNILVFPAEFREALLSIVESKEFPLDINCIYGDGTAIEASVLEEICSAYRQATVVFPWQRGDIMMLDNMLIAHGRRSFSGSRKVVVAMGEPYSAGLLDDLCTNR